MSIYGGFCYARNWATGNILAYVKDWVIVVRSYDDKPGSFNGVLYISSSLEPAQGFDGAQEPPPLVMAFE